MPKEEASSKAKKYAQDAMRLDPDLPASHASLAFLDFEDWNWSAANQEFQSAIALAPGLAEPHLTYSKYLAAMGSAEAVTEAQRAVDLDPVSISAHNAAAVAAFCSGQSDRAIQEGSKILELDPNDPQAYLDMSVGHLQKGIYQQALQEVDKGLLLSHRDPFFLAFAAAVHGRLGQIEQATKLVEEMQVDGKKVSVAPYFFAIAFAGMGQQKRAIDALKEGYKTHDAYMVALKSDPLLSSLHSSPDFQDLVNRMHFPPGSSAVPQQLQPSPGHTPPLS